MSVQNEIDRITQNVANTYAAMAALGADMPEAMTSDNLARTAGTAKAVLYSEQSLTPEQQAQARENIGVGDTPDALPNPYPLTINGKPYDGSEAVDVMITGGTAGGSTSLGQTPVTLTQSANIKLVGDGEYSYAIKGKTIADISTAAIAKTNVTLTETEHYMELTVSGSPANWYNSFAAFTFSGLTVDESYVFCIESLGIDNVNLTYNGYFLIRNANGTELGRIEDKPAGLASVTFTASTDTVVVSWYPSNGYYWNNGYRTALVGDIYINKASDGTERTGVFNESGTFTDSYSLGQLQKGITITSDPSCEVYSVSIGGGSGEASAPLAGKTVVCFGDSLFGMYTGDTSAPAFVALKTGATVHNVGFSGCRMSEHPYTGYNEFCMYALANAIASGDWSLQDANAASGSSNFPDQLAILKSIDFGTVDAIVIHYGTNDFAAGEGVAVDDASEPKSTNTLCGALRYSVETLLTAFPKLKIFVSLPAFRYWTADDGTVTYSDEKKNVNGYTLPEFIKALAETAKEYNLPVIDCYYGLGINKSNATTFLADGTHHNIEGRRRFGEYIGAKLISNGDIFLGTDSATGGGSASIDVTAEVGQTIVVEEVDADGKPTKWKAVEYQPRTHWEDGAEILLPETTIEVNSNNEFVLEGSFAIVEGNHYTVVWNGVEYECVGKLARVVDYGTSIPYLGNSILTGDGYDTGEPFAIITPTLGFIAIAPLENITTLTISIKTPAIHKIPTKYIPTLEDMRTEEPVVLMDITVECEEQDGAMLGQFDGYVDLTNGAQYVVAYNGVEYGCKASVMYDGPDEKLTALGNLHIFDNVYPDTGEPFIIGMVYDKESAYGDTHVVCGDGSTSVTLSITQYERKPIPVEYVTNALPYYIDALADWDGITGNDPTNYVFNDTAKNVARAFAEGREIKLRVRLNGGVRLDAIYNLVCGGQFATGAVYMFTLPVSTYDNTHMHAMALIGSFKGALLIAGTEDGGLGIFEY